MALANSIIILFVAKQFIVAQKFASNKKVSKMWVWKVEMFSK